MAQIPIQTPAGSQAQVDAHRVAADPHPGLAATAGPPAVVGLTDAATIVIDAALGDIFDVTLAGNRTLGNPTGAVNGQKLLFRIKQDATGNRTLAFGTKYRFGTDLTSAVLSTIAGKIDRVGVEYVSADDKFDVIALMRGF